MQHRKTIGAALVVAGLVAGVGRAQERSEQFYQTIRQNDLAGLARLLKAGNPNEKDSRQSTPLLYAASVGSIEAMRALVAAGADVNASNAFGATPLMLSAGEPDKVRFLVQHRADVNAVSKMGRTPLMLAAFVSNNSETVKFLLEKGAKVEARDKSGTTPLIAAAYASDTAAMKILLDRGAGVNDQDAGGFSPLLLAAWRNNPDAVKVLLAKGAEVNHAMASSYGEAVKNGPIQIGLLTPLLGAATYGSPEMLATLLDAGAKIDVQDVRGMTPLMLAVASDHASAASVKLLVDRGADVSKKDKYGQTAGDWARKYNAPAVLAALGVRPAAETTSLNVVPAIASAKTGAAEAVTRALKLLQTTNNSFLAEGGCGACHSHMLTGVAVTAAAARHIPVNQVQQSEELKGALLQLGGGEQPFLQRMDPPAPEILGFALLQFGVEEAPADRGIDAMVYSLVGQQLPDGSWNMGLARPPMTDGPIGRTALSIRALRHYGAPGRKADFERRIARAADFLCRATPVTADDRAMKMLGLYWAGAEKREVEECMGALLSEQLPDGGWSPTPNLPADAYATGSAMWALRQVGMNPRDAAYQRGAAYLLRTQNADGSWYVKSRAPKFQPYFESGFPYGGDQWISEAATAWAAAALSYAIDDRQIAGMK